MAENFDTIKKILIGGNRLDTNNFSDDAVPADGVDARRRARAENFVRAARQQTMQLFSSGAGRRKARL